ncbi:MAG: DUF1501 domain-containing protein, partial [Gemmataceae bacterium]|nr:DUF1501 domain-containing protein [Gemmataceae bacterium]
WDLKPGHKNGGPFKEIQTSAPGLRIGEHLPGVAKFGDKMAVIRSMTTKEADHSRGTLYMRTGYQPTGPIQYPPLGALLSKELGRDENPLPNSVAIAPYRFFAPAAYGSGFLGPKHAPLVVGDNAQFLNPRPGATPDYDRALKVQDVDLAPGVDKAHADSRLDLLVDMEKEFIARHPGTASSSHKTAYERAVRLMKTDARKAFDLDEEKDSVRDAYGRSLFGQGCLLARRLIERGVPFVEVTHAGNNNGGLGWDTHGDNFNLVRGLCETLDKGWAALMGDLKARGLLDSTLIVWMGEFGRTPLINPGNGRDHWPNSWATVLAGGGINGGQAYGATSADGASIKDKPVSVPDFMATIVAALGIDPAKTNNSNVGRPIRLADKPGNPIKEIVA